MAAKKIKKAVPKKANTKKAVVKKVAAQKKGKQAAPEKPPPPTPPATRGIIIPDMDGIPCICIKATKGWFCMKKEDGALIQCDGPFATKEECEAHVCI
jgi:hypothetical protein